MRWSLGGRISEESDLRVWYIYTHGNMKILTSASMQNDPENDTKVFLFYHKLIIILHMKMNRNHNNFGTILTT